MVFDWDDQCEEQDALPLLHKLREIRPDFRCTLFAIPTKGSHEFWDSHPDWIELAYHGWAHETVYECAYWDAEPHMASLIRSRKWNQRFTTGFKAPGWQISDGCYEALAAADWWVADQAYNNDRRPAGLRAHILNVGPDHWHGHVQNVCGNGLEETWDEVVALVKAAPSFEFMSEVVA